MTLSFYIQDQIKRKSELKTIFSNIYEDLETLFEPIIAEYVAKDFSNNACKYFISTLFTDYIRIICIHSI